ncbi:p21-C-terminal region-binding protein-domain-containing protein [Polychytrium aggregatum]|uniref:p21-C-terminal region-binding protein-domain-containing protein n=1 Tax=Polychytrium aggregatum TaxID=110093 RepID=UPI0022FEC7FD|nr:p21-C-terminal region-binding protein-domain-containing protein [Polychytrium aggregatum]KAI9188524.1 p21-C-terminal region-binding protein-domain-containing protein [Polychytrium aggregatum]
MAAKAELVDVDFVFSEPQEIDFHGLKSLLRQTFGDDADNLPLSELASTVIDQSYIGSCVKVEGELDPYAVMSVLNLSAPKDRESISSIRAYLLQKAKKNAEMQRKLAALLESSDHHIGLLINERLINMPHQVVPAMLKMLLQEVDKAIQESKPFKFEYYIMISKTYKEVESQLEQDSDGEDKVESQEASKKNKKQRLVTVYYFQQEDELIEEFADFSYDYKFSKEGSSSDSKRAFQEYGIDPSRRVFVIHRSKLPEILKRFEKVLSA